MENQNKDTLRLQLDNLKQCYAQELPYISAKLKILLSELQKEPSLSCIKQIHKEIQGLATSSGNFGFNDLSNTACTLEIHLKSLVKNKLLPSNIQVKQIALLLKKIDQTSTYLVETSDFESQNYLHSDSGFFKKPEQFLIYLLGTSLKESHLMAFKIRHFGYKITSFPQIDSLLMGIKKLTPSVLIVDISDFPSEYINILAELQNKLSKPIPIIFISKQNELKYRLAAIRVGGKYYLCKPLGIEEIIDKLDALSQPNHKEPYRILIIENEPATASQYASTLESAKMVTEVIYNPTYTIDKMIEFNPDVIMMDMYMAINGLELAMVIRQHESFISVPIIFVSTESNVDKHMLVMGMGIDVFLTKPIKPHHLVMAVKSKAKRARQLLAFMERDSLTGLYNHTIIREKLNLEISRADREKHPLCFAMLDIDHFKQVNDVHGHLMGDRIIKGLARLLKQRLRKTDIVGRYGGEEFAIIFPNTKASSGKEVLEELLKTFGAIEHISPKGKFMVTFSAGIASLSDYTSATHINDAADKALYEAKQNGRNCIKIAKSKKVSLDYLDDFLDDPRR